MKDSTTLKISEFGNPVLRYQSKKLTKKQITSVHVRDLVNHMKIKLEKEKNGVGLASPQVGENLAVFIIDIKPTKNRPNLKEANMIAFNPIILENVGKKFLMWESCISVKGSIFAQVPRYRKIKVRYFDERAKLHEKIITGFLAHVFQHEIDHLNGVLFVDKVTNPKSYMSAREYRKMTKNKKMRKQ